MNHSVSVSHVLITPPPASRRLTALVPGWPALQVQDGVTDAGFIGLYNAFRATGGMAGGAELANRLNVLGCGGYARLARCIVSQQVFSFAWNGEFWVPLFQFDTSNWSVRSGLRPLLLELTAVSDGASIARWFVQPNHFLQGDAPLTRWQVTPTAVLEAARSERLALSSGTRRPGPHPPHSPGRWPGTT